jgi:hypothetical protein
VFHPPTHDEVRDEDDGPKNHEGRDCHGNTIVQKKPDRTLSGFLYVTRSGLVAAV